MFKLLSWVAVYARILVIFNNLEIILKRWYFLISAYDTTVLVNESSPFPVHANAFEMASNSVRH